MGDSGGLNWGIKGVVDAPCHLGPVQCFIFMKLRQGGEIVLFSLFFEVLIVEGCTFN